MVDWLCIKIAIRIDKKFAVEAEAEQVVSEVVVTVDGFDKVDESNGVDRHRGIALS